MRLTDLDPRWISESGRNDQMGISFDCPCEKCRGAEPPFLARRIGVWFENPIDGGPAASGHLLWRRTGETFETLTLSPSIDMSKHGHWHGFITNGEFT